MKFDSRPYIVAGPCSAESSDQIFDTSSALKDAGVEWFRAGLWKPRTQPGCFEGVGLEGIPWMVKVQQELGMRICTEVSSAATARACLDAGFDAVWIGARTTSNPFLVQEIADSLAGADITVMVKNPLDPNLSVWCGAIERLKAAGLRDIVAIHRGFSDSGMLQYRNAPNWKLALDLKARYPHMAVLCDPSHIAGKACYVQEVALRAIGLGLDGLMVECHLCPSSALSDASQQLDPAGFADLLSGIRRNEQTEPQAGFEAQLSELRAEIDALDEQLLKILSDRQAVSERIGELKKGSRVKVVQEDRWKEVLESVADLSERYGLDSQMTTRIFNIIHEASVSRQNQILLGDDKD